MGPTALLPLRRKACWGFFRPKNPTASAGCEPTNLGTKGQHTTSRPPKPLACPSFVLNKYERFKTQYRIFRRRIIFLSFMRMSRHSPSDLVWYTTRRQCVHDKNVRKQVLHWTQIPLRYILGAQKNPSQQYSRKYLYNKNQ